MNWFSLNFVESEWNDFACFSVAINQSLKRTQWFFIQDKLMCSKNYILFHFDDDIGILLSFH